MVYSAWVKQKQQANSAKFWIKQDNHWKIIYEGAV
jgi:hypothetical protein